MPNRTERHGPTAPIKYGAVSWWLTVVCVILLAVIAAAGSVLGLFYRADAHVALGNAKTVRMALYADVLTACKVPGDFWVLQTDKNGYTVQQMIYTEGDFTVTYTADPVTWNVSVGVDLIHTAVTMRNAVTVPAFGLRTVWRVTAP